MESNKNFKVVTEKETKIKKGFRGWEAETLTSVNGQTYKIFTLKRHNGFLSTSAMPVQVRKADGFQTMEFDSDAIFNKTISLVSEKVSRVNEKAVKEQHYQALTVFENMVFIGEVQPEKKNVPEIGSILFLDGYGKGKGSHGNKHVVFSIEDTQYGIKYFTVELDTLSLQVKNYVKNYDDKFGIGTYFQTDYKFEGSQDDLSNLIIDAKKLEKEEAKKEEASKLMKAQIRKGKIEEGKKTVKIPKWAKSVIVADYYENTSDSQTDYFNATSRKTVYLAFSKTTRNNMNELKTASKRFKETENFIELFENPVEEEDKIEEFTKGHSILPNYYFGSSSWSGWKVSKERYIDLSDEKTIEMLCVASAEGRYFCEQEKNSQEVVKGFKGLEIVDYSEKAIAVIGETKNIKDELKKLGGRYNPRLKCGAGWIFPKTKMEDIQKLLSNEQI